MKCFGVVPPPLVRSALIAAVFPSPVLFIVTTRDQCVSCCLVQTNCRAVRPIEQSSISVRFGSAATLPLPTNSCVKLPEPDSDSVSLPRFGKINGPLSGASSFPWSARASSRRELGLVNTPDGRRRPVKLRLSRNSIFSSPHNVSVDSGMEHTVSDGRYRSCGSAGKQPFADDHAAVGTFHQLVILTIIGPIVVLSIDSISCVHLSKHHCGHAIFLGAPAIQADNPCIIRR